MRLLLIFAITLISLACGSTSTGANANVVAVATPPVNTSTPSSSAASGNVNIRSADGLVLVGSIYPSDKPNSPAVLLLHQWQSDRHSYDAFAKQLQAKGFNVLSIDGRGFGESTKTGDGKTVTPERTDAAVKAMLGDVEAAFKYLSEQKNVDPKRIGIVGASYGSSLALIYAADHPNVAAVALLSPGLNYFGNMPTEPSIKKYGDRPILLVAADDDKESADSVKKLKADGANDKYEVQIYPKGGHGTGLFGAKVGLENLLEGFFTKSLK
ncbi:MAG TPA: alpha/beta fold hydrolase [Pyrinomonadaceae bacterium]|nr:alpha/beta fold hydrolase [Pyrinomonadaceae bacterium]